MVISIGDLNDNSPLFSQETYSAIHNEHNDFDLVVAEVTATDSDAGSNGEVRYRITGGNSNNIFGIDQSSVGHMRMRERELVTVVNVFPGAGSGICEDAGL